MSNNQLDRRKELLITSHNLPFRYIESYKSLRTNLEFLALNRKVKKIIVTSSISQEGKSTVAINLAISLGQSGKKVVLIDCDLRKPRIHRYLHISMKKFGGLTSILTDSLAIEDCVVCIPDYKLYVITSGAIPPNPAELLGTPKMEAIINALADRFDYVIIDTPPVSVVTDAAILSKTADGVIFVLRQNYTKLGTAVAAKKQLDAVNAHILGCVFNVFKSDKTNKSYEYYDYNYDYSYK